MAGVSCASSQEKGTRLIIQAARRLAARFAYFLGGPVTGGRLRRLAAVAAEGPGRGELAELVADHVLGHVQLDEVPAVVDGEVLADELGHDRAGPRPGLDRLAAAGGVGPVHLLEQPLDDVRAFLERTSHGCSLTSGEWRVVEWRVVSECGRSSSSSPLATRHSPLAAQIFSWPYRTLVRRRMMALFDGLRRRRVLPPLASTPVGEQGCAAARGPAFAAAHRVVDRVHGDAADVRPAAQPPRLARPCPGGRSCGRGCRPCRSSPGRRRGCGGPRPRGG